MYKKNYAGFTLFEIIFAVALLGILSVVVVSGFVSFKKISDLNNDVQEFASLLKSAQSRALSSDGNTQYGVYLNIGVLPNQYVLFKGESYALRTASSDQVHVLQNTTEFYEINLGGGNEIVFDRLTGASGQTGSVSIRHKNDPNLFKTIYIAGSGTVGFNPPETLSDENRIKDTRHMHFAYSRAIDTVSENIVLTFDDIITQTIPIISFLSGNELLWQGTVTVGGSDQTVEIRTHKLNDNGTLFSVRRDRRYNNKSLEIAISGDSSGYLIRYSADGSATSSSSMYTSSPSAQ